MGRKTYEKGLELGGGINPTKDKKNYICSRDQRPSDGKEKDDEEVEFVDHDIIEFVEQLVNSSGKDIWLVGGSEIISLLLKANLLHDIILSIHSKILGIGIPLFKNIRKLINCNTYECGLI
jgi:dihydrofolate reductase